MSRLVGRHSLSEANNRNNYGTPAFGHPDAPLMPEGRPMAQDMGRIFQVKYDIIPAQTPAAVSDMKRSDETAEEAGFEIRHPYVILNEVDTGLPYAELKAMMAERQNTAAALKAAELILENPPEERVWITHGLVIAGLCEILGVADQFEHFVPAFCEIRELPV